MPKPDPDNQSPRMVWTDDLATAEDVAKTAGVKPHTVDKWVVRHRDTPIPVKITTLGRLYLLSDWIRWLESTGRADGRLPTFAEQKALRTEEE